MSNDCHSRLAMTTAALAWAVTAALSSTTAVAEPASGTINYQSRAGALAINAAYVYLVKGPDVVSGKTVRQLIFASADIGAKLQACATMSCASGAA